MIQPLPDTCLVCGRPIWFNLPNRGVKSETSGILYANGECCGVSWLRVFIDMPLDIYSRTVEQIIAKGIVFCEQTLTLEQMAIARAEVCVFQASGKPS